MNMWRRVFVLVMSEGVPMRALLVALVIGTILNVINQGDAFVDGTPVNWIKLALTYLTPYLVCTHGAVAARLHEAG